MLIPEVSPGQPRKFQDSDIVTADVLFPAWDFSNANPIFFSKAFKNKLEKTNPLYGANFNDAIYGSASNVIYFDSAKIEYGNN